MYLHLVEAILSLFFLTDRSVTSPPSFSTHPAWTRFQPIRSDSICPGAILISLARLAPSLANQLSPY